MTTTSILLFGQTWYVSEPLGGAIVRLFVRSSGNIGRDLELCRGSDCRHDLIIQTARGAIRLDRLDSYTIFVIKKYLGAAFRASTACHFTVHADRFAAGGGLCSERFRYAHQICSAVEEHFGYTPQPRQSIDEVEACRNSMPWYTKMLSTLQLFKQEIYGPVPTIPASLQEVAVDLLPLADKRKRKQVQRFAPTRLSTQPRKAIMK